MIGVELADHEAQEAVVQAAFERRLLTLPAGRSTVRLCPPLVLTDEEADEGAERLLAALHAVEEVRR
jgi:4-aminobutyrate aminotransferase